MGMAGYLRKIPKEEPEKQEEGEKLKPKPANPLLKYSAGVIGQIKE